ncbi:unnamed protein product [Allacma fusca]|uniref:Uncharacterized protein n=1 Tax=Allacma fusca TaxID=39272 RepID=A0A8J2PE10_9HEXA|nr:unnamed protein product [Allacma fusca]
MAGNPKSKPGEFDDNSGLSADELEATTDPLNKILASLECLTKDSAEMKKRQKAILVDTSTIKDDLAAIKNTVETHTVSIK